MGSLYEVGESRYRTFTLVVDTAQRETLNQEFVQNFLDKSWPLLDMTADIGDASTADRSKDGIPGDIAAIITVTKITTIVEDADDIETLETEVNLYQRQHRTDEERTSGLPNEWKYTGQRI